MATDRDIDVGTFTPWTRPSRPSFSTGGIVFGTEVHRRELAEKFAGELPTSAESSEHVAATAARLVDSSN